MKTTAPKSYGILAVAALFGVVALAVSYLVLDFAGFASCLIGAIVALVTAIVLWLGWREPAAGPTGPRDLSPNATRTAGSGPNASATPAPAVSPAAAAATTTATGAPATEAPAATSPAPVADPVRGSSGSATSNSADAPTSTSKPASAAPATAGSAPAAPASSASTSAAPAAAVTTTEPVATSPAPVADPVPAPEPAPASSPAVETAAAAKTPPAKTAPKAKKASKPDVAPASAGAPATAQDKPEMLAQPRGGAGDDLKQIKGVGPKLEKMLNDMGVWHFDQVASWKKKEVQWVDENLQGFKGRVSRDEWVKQAKVLAKGGTTEFSSKVKKGGVY